MPVNPTYSPYISRRTVASDFDMIYKKSEIMISSRLRFSDSALIDGKGGLVQLQNG